MINDDQQQLITKYLRGTLSEKEEATMKAYLQDEAFKEELEFQSTLQKALELENREEIREKVETLKKKTLAEYQASPADFEQEQSSVAPDTHTEPTRERSISSYWIWVAAASLILIVSLVFILIDIGGGPAIDHLAWAGAAKGEAVEYSNALEAYEQRDYERAKALFENIPEKEKSEELMLYNAINLLLLYQEETNQGEIEQAIKYLVKLVSDGGNYQETAEWYLALAYLIHGDEEKANTLLAKIANEPMHPYADKARSKLK